MQRLTFNHIKLRLHHHSGLQGRFGLVKKSCWKSLEREQFWSCSNQMKICKLNCLNGYEPSSNIYLKCHCKAGICVFIRHYTGWNCLEIHMNAFDYGSKNRSVGSKIDSQKWVFVFKFEILLLQKWILLAKWTFLFDLILFPLLISNAWHHKIKRRVSILCCELILKNPTNSCPFMDINPERLITVGIWLMSGQNMDFGRVTCIWTIAFFNVVWNLWQFPVNVKT